MVPLINTRKDFSFLLSNYGNVRGKWMIKKHVNLHSSIIDFN